MPTFAVLGVAGRDFQGSWFGWLKDETLSTYLQTYEDPVRRQIDDAAIKALGVE